MTPCRKEKWRIVADSPSFPGNLSDPSDQAAGFDRQSLIAFL
jgi:hypothetical protein